MGVSKYKTRSDLLREKATGHAPDVAPYKQDLFDRGHAAEAAARPLVEAHIGDELYPTTGALEVNGLPLLASFDGINMTGNLLWESKLWNADLAAAIECNRVDPQYWPQLEQQLLVSGAERVFFTTTDGTSEKLVGTWYESVPERRTALLAAWHQFADDLANYQHIDIKPQAVAGAVVNLPSVSVQVSGQLAIIDNFSVFETALRDFIDKRLIRKPQTDQDFADLDTQIKTLKKAEDALIAAEANVVAQVVSIDAMKRTKDMLYKMARDNRLMAEKLLEAEKLNRRAAIQEGGKKAFAEHLAALNTRLGKPYMPAVPADFVGITRGKRTIDSLQEAVDVELRRAKIAASEIADRIQVGLESLRTLAADYTFLFADTAQIVLKANDDLVALIKTRIAEHKEREAQIIENERTQKAAEEARRVEKEHAERIRRQEEDARRAALIESPETIVTNTVVYDNSFSMDCKVIDTADVCVDDAIQEGKMHESVLARCPHGEHIYGRNRCKDCHIAELEEKLSTAHAAKTAAEESEIRCAAELGEALDKIGRMRPVVEEGIKHFRSQPNSMYDAVRNYEANNP